MSCSRGAASPNSHTAKRLFAASAGYCQNPACHLPLFADTGSNQVLIGEIAHICAAQDRGPRANASLSKAERGSFENLILLCANCHTKIDRAPADYPDEMILRWKRDQQLALEQMYGAVALPTREDVRAAIRPLLRANHMLFEENNPDLSYREDLESGLALDWKRMMRERIIPANRRILAILDVNQSFLTDCEERTLELFRQHVYDLEARHLLNDPVNTQKRFPMEMNDMMGDSPINA
jgi:hypothetical protein